MMPTSCCTGSISGKMALLGKYIMLHPPFFFLFTRSELLAINTSGEGEHGCLDSSGREIRKYTRLLGITSEIHKAARYHEWENIPHGNGG